MITNADITVYNRQFDPSSRKTVFLRHEVRHVSWHAKLAVAADPGGLSGGNVFQIRIPQEAETDSLPALAGYLPPGEYRGLPEAERAGRWTVDAGDYFCRGTGPEMEKPSDLKDHALPYGQVKSVSDNRRGSLPHIRIEGW